MARQAGRPGRHGPRPVDPGPDGRHHPGHQHGHLRLGPAPVRGARRRSWTTATSSATSRWASSRRSVPTSPRPAPGDRVVIPFNISCGALLHVRRRACSPSARRPRCATRARARRCSATRSCTAQVPGGQAEYLRVPQAQFGPIKVPRRAARRPLRVPVRRAADGLAGRRVRRDPRRAAPSSCSGSGRSATWRAASPATAAPTASSASTSSPSGSSAARARGRRGARPERRATTSPRRSASSPAGAGPDAVIDAVGMEAHGSPVGKFAQTVDGVAARRAGRASSWSRRRRPAGGACTRRSTSCAAAARSRSSASTAA